MREGVRPQWHFKWLSSAMLGLVVGISCTPLAYADTPGVISVASSFAGGNGTPANPYLIQTPGQLLLMEEQINADIGTYPSDSYQLIADINMNSFASWVPINNFRGTFNGDGYWISNLEISSTVADASSYVDSGLFGSTEPGSILENVKLNQVSVAVSISNSQQSAAGALVGDNQGTVQNVAVANGGVSFVQNNPQSLSVNDVGGLVGMNMGAVSNAYSTSTVWTNRSNASEQVFAGGLAGGNTGTIADSFSTGNVSGQAYAAGGLIGISLGAVENAYAAGSVIGNYHMAGGLLGYSTGNATTSHTYSIGSVNANGGSTGGLVGYGNAISYSFWDTQTSGQTVASSTDAGPTGVTGETTPSLTQQGTFSGWDFTNTWGIVQGESFPYLRQLTPIVPRITLSGSAQSVGSGGVLAVTGSAFDMDGSSQVAVSGLPILLDAPQGTWATSGPNLGNGLTIAYTDGQGHIQMNWQAPTAVNPTTLIATSNGSMATLGISGGGGTISPLDLQAQGTTETQTTLTWNWAPNESFTVYENGIAQPLAANLTSSSYTVSNLAPGATYVFTVVAFSTVNNSLQSSTISVSTLGAQNNGHERPLLIRSRELHIGLYGHPYRARLMATGGNRSYVWTLISGALPAGLTLNPQGWITGVPDGPPGRSTFSVEVTSGGETAVQQFSLAIRNPDDFAFPWMDDSYFGNYDDHSFGLFEQFFSFFHMYQ